MKRLGVLDEAGKQKRNEKIEKFNEVLALMRKNGPQCEIEKMCKELSREKYARSCEFDDLARLMFFNIIKGKAIDQDFRKATYYFLKSVDPMYLVDFFSVLDHRTFGKMRVIFSDKDMLKILSRINEDGLIHVIEQDGPRHEVERFMDDSMKFSY